LKIAMMIEKMFRMRGKKTSKLVNAAAMWDKIAALKDLT
jgi:hypothetical protein